MSKIVKGIGRAVKSIFKGIKKVFKKVVKSDLFKVAAAGALIYFGGQALGAWGGGGGTAAGAGPGTAAGEAAVAGGAESTVAGTAAAESVGAASTAGSGATQAANMTLAGGGEGVGTGMGLTSSVGSAPPVQEGFISKALKGAGSFVKKHPMASAMGLNAVSSALSPDEEELMREKERIRRERWQNMQVPGSVGMESSGQPLRRLDGTPVYSSNNPRGMINSRIRRTS